MVHGDDPSSVLLLAPVVVMLLLVEMVVVNSESGDYAFNGTIVFVLFLFIVPLSLVSRQANSECFGHICSLLLSPLFSLFSLFSFFLWIDLLDLAIPKRVKRPLLAVLLTV